MENAWTVDIFNDLTEKDLEDALLTDITSKPTAKSEPVDVDIFGICLFLLWFHRIR